MDRGRRTGPHDRRDVGDEALTAAAPTVPVLSLSSLQELVRRARPPERRSRPRRIAVFGAAPDLPRVDTEDGTFELVTVHSELELRERLFADRRDDAVDGRIFLLAWPAAGALLPLDLRHAFAGERVHRLVARDRLEQRMGGLRVTEDVAASELGQLLDAIPPDRLPRYDAPTIDMAGAWRVYLAAQVGLPILSRPDGSALLLWLLVARGGPEHARELQGKKTLPKELEGFLGREFGALGSAAWRAFEEERGRSFVVGGLVIDALLSALRDEAPLSAEDSGAATLRLRQLRGEHKVSEELLAIWGAQAAEAIRDLAATGKRTVAMQLSELRSVDVAALLREADARTDHLPDRLVAPSDLLPRAAVARLAALSELAASLVAQATPPADSLDRLRERLAAIDEHARIGAEARATARNLARLAAYVVCERRGTLKGAPSDMRASTTSCSGAIQPLREWAAFQAQHGGHMDWLARELAHAHVDTLRPGIASTRAAVAESRARSNRTFASRLQAWHRADAPSDVLPQLFEVGARVIAPWLDDKDNPGRTLFVLMLDGLSWGVATELFDSLQGLGWGPVPAEAGRESAPVALAALPTITSISRTAFFAGQLPAPGTAEPSSNLDTTRFAAHPALARFDPELFVKKTLGTGVELPAAVADTIRDRERRLVGAVVNAVDDWLSGPQQIAHGFSVETVKPLRALLSLCAEVGRTVLIVADHGHTLNEDMTLPEESAHSRWRLPDEPPDEGELLFAGKRVWCPPGSAGVVLPFVSGATYKVKKVGHHGGATIEEVVVPVVFLEPNGNTFPEPHWWRLEAGVSAPTSAPEWGTSPAFAPQEAPLFEAPVAIGGLAARLMQSDVWKERKKLLPGRFPEDRLYALLDAMERRPRLSGVEFTEVTGEPERRMAGFASQAGGALNAGGMEVLHFDREQRRLVLNLELLEQVFEVSRG